MSQEIKDLYYQMNTVQKRLEDGIIQVRAMRKGLQSICPHKFINGFMFSTCEYCGEEV